MVRKESSTTFQTAICQVVLGVSKTPCLPTSDSRAMCGAEIMRLPRNTSRHETCRKLNSAAATRTWNPRSSALVFKRSGPLPTSIGALHDSVRAFACTKAGPLSLAPVTGQVLSRLLQFCTEIFLLYTRIARPDSTHILILHLQVTIPSLPFGILILEELIIEKPSLQCIVEQLPSRPHSVSSRNRP